MKTTYNVLFCLILVYLRRAESRKCFISEIKHSSVNGFFNKIHTEQECKNQKFPLEISLPENISINCFKIVGTDLRGIETAIKGCISAGKCEELKKTTMNSTKLPLDAKCYECETDNCNMAPKIQNFGTVISLFTAFIHTFIIHP